MPGWSKVCSTGALPGLFVPLETLQLALVEFTVCEVCDSSNSHRTVSPAGIVTFGGTQREPGLSSRASMTDGRGRGRTRSEQHGDECGDDHGQHETSPTHGLPLPLRLCALPARAPQRAPFGNRREEYTSVYKVSSVASPNDVRQKRRRFCRHLVRSEVRQETGTAARWRSTTRAQRRPSAIAFTTSDWPIRASPAANTPGREVA